MSFLLSLVLKFLSDGAVEKALDYLRADAAHKNGQAKIRAEVTITEIEAAVAHTKAMADLQKSKFEHWAFWALSAAFVVPLAFWWSAVILDSVFLFGWGVASVPILEEWGGQTISWSFYTGTAVGALKMLR